MFADIYEQLRMTSMIGMVSYRYVSKSHFIFHQIEMIVFPRVSTFRMCVDNEQTTPVTTDTGDTSGQRKSREKRGKQSTERKDIGMQTMT